MKYLSNHDIYEQTQQNFGYGSTVNVFCKQRHIYYFYSIQTLLCAVTKVIRNHAWLVCLEVLVIIIDKHLIWLFLLTCHEALWKINYISFIAFTLIINIYAMYVKKSFTKNTFDFGDFILLYVTIIGIVITLYENHNNY